MSNANKNGFVSENGLFLVTAVVDRSKADSISDLMQMSGSNFQFACRGRGTYGDDSVRADKTVLFAVIKEEKKDALMRQLDDRFRKLKRSAGAAWAVPFTSVIGVAVFGFLADTDFEESPFGNAGKQQAKEDRS